MSSLQERPANTILVKMKKEGLGVSKRVHAHTHTHNIG